MQRLILTIVLIILISCSANAEQLPGYKDITRKNNPVLCKYLTDYAIYLNNQLSVKMFSRRCVNHIYYALYDEDGRMLEEPTDKFSYLFLSQKLRKQIKKLPPPPLPEEIKGQNFIIKYFFVQGVKNNNKIIISSDTDEYNYFLIMIIKKDDNIENLTQKDIYIEDYNTLLDNLYKR